MTFSIRLGTIYILIGVFVIVVTSWLAGNSPKLPQSSDIRDSYENVKNQFRSGDLIFFSGTTSGEDFCKMLSNSRFSHVGLVVRDIGEDRDVLQQGSVYIFDSDIHHGSRLQLLDDKVKKFKGDQIIGWKRLSPGITDPLEYQKYLSIMHSMLNKEFDNRMLTWYFSDYDWLWSYFKKDTYFCSEIISIILYRMGIISEGKKFVSYSPGDFDLDINSYVNEGYRFTSTKLLRMK